jgi:hypothetical protein
VEEGRTPGFLPPRPAGPEPELGPAPGAPPSYQPPAGAGPAPAAPPAWQQQQPPPGHWTPQPRQPDNGPAVAGFVLSLVGGSLVLLTVGFSSIVSVGLSIAGIVYSRKGRELVTSGHTQKNAGLAQAGFVIGIVSLVLAVLATIAWIAILVLVLTDDSFRNDLQDEYDSGQTVSAALCLGATTIRVAAHLLV